jgi:alcohol dehydrogenase
VGGGISIGEWVRERTGGYGADAVIDALPPGAPAAAWMEAADAVRVGGRHVDIGAVNEPLTFPGYWIKARNATVVGSRWFTTAEGQDMAEMAGAGTLDLSVFEHRRYALADVNEAIAALEGEIRGFDNFVVMP